MASYVERDERYLEICEQRFGALADGLGYCAKCPLRPGFLAFMGEEDPVNVPDAYRKEARTCRAGGAILQIT